MDLRPTTYKGLTTDCIVNIHAWDNTVVARNLTIEGMSIRPHNMRVLFTDCGEWIIGLTSRDFYAVIVKPNNRWK